MRQRWRPQLVLEQLGLILCLVAAGAADVAASSTAKVGQVDAQALVDAWAATGSCRSDSLRGKCGVVAAVANAAGTVVTAQARAGGGIDLAPPPFQLDTSLFEIASNTKVLTALAMQSLVASGKLSLTNTVGSIAGSAVVNRFRNASVGTITLRELATHTSGLARLPTNLHGTPANPFTNYTEDDLWSYLGSLAALPGRGSFYYSNLGFGLLGHLLELRTGKSYVALLHRLVLGPFAMAHSTVTVAETNWSAVAPGTSSNGSVAERDTPYGVLKGQGCVHSSAGDMIRFLAICVAAGGSGSGSGPLPPALAAAVVAAATPLAPNDFPAQRGAVGLGWEMYYSRGSRVVWKGGGTAGYGSFMAFSPTTGRSAVALASCGNCGSKAVDQLVRLLLEPPRAPSHPPLPVTPGQLARYIGKYRLPALADENRQPSRPASLVTVTSHSGPAGSHLLRLSLGDGGGSALLAPFRKTREAETHRSASASMQRVNGTVLPLRFLVVPANDTLCLRPRGCGPLEHWDSAAGQREVYFLRASASGDAQLFAEATVAADTLVLHMDGVDFFAPRASAVARAAFTR